MYENLMLTCTHTHTHTHIYTHTHTHTHTHIHTHTHTHSQSESSGAVTDITNSTSVESAASVPIEEIPDLFLKIAKKEMKNSPPGSLLKFGTEGVRGKQGEGLGFNSTVDPPEETEVYRRLSEHTVSMVLHRWRSQRHRLLYAK